MGKEKTKRAFRLELPTSDGWELALYEYPLKKKPKAAALCLHAIMADSRTLDAPAGSGLCSILAENGIKTYRLDFRGCGKSKPGQGKIDFSFDDMGEDILCALRYIKQKNKNLKIFIAGHSLGGSLSMMLLSRGEKLPVSGLAMYSVNVWAPEFEKNRYLWFQKSIRLFIMGFMTRIFGRLPARKFGAGTEDLPGKFIQQWISWRKSGWISADGKIRYTDRMGKIKLPLLSHVAAGDTLYSHPAAVKEFVSRTGSKDRTVEVWGKQNGLASDLGHMELMMDPEAAAVHRRTVQWMLERT